MAIDLADKKTVDAFEGAQKRGRGRPSTGQAKTPAQRQKAYRQRQKAAGSNNRNGQAPAALSVTRNVVRGLLYYVNELRTDELQRLGPDELALLDDKLGLAKMLVWDVIDKGRARNGDA